MSTVVVVPRGAASRKPSHGAPCNRCGVCCMGSLCNLARAVFGDRPGPCPALVMDGAQASCGLTEVEDAEAAAAARLLIGAGDGCDCRINGEPPDRGFYRRVAELDRARMGEIRNAIDVWRPAFKSVNQRSKS